MREDRFAEYTDRILAENERRRREIPADFYSPMRLPNVFINAQRNRCLVQLLRHEKITSLAGRRILDVGCGTGEWLLELLSWGATPALLSGIDIDPKQIAEAERKLPQADLRVGNAVRLPWRDTYFDIVLQATLFSSILDPALRKAAAAEMMRVAKPGGLILWYDSRVNNPWNPDLRGIRAVEIRRLFSGCSLKARSTTLLPPLAREIVPMSWVVALLLETLPFLRTHLLGCVRLPGTGHPLHARNERRTPTDAPDKEEIRCSPMSRSLVEGVVDLHILCFPDFFLTGLGRKILTRYYNHYNGRADSICFVARSSSGRVIGLGTGSRNYEKFLRSFYRSHFVALALAVARAFFRNRDLREKIRVRTPYIRGAVLSFFPRRSPPRQAPASQTMKRSETAGLASLAVHPHFRRQGVATELYRLFEQRASQLGVRRIEASVLLHNTRTIALNKKVGMRVIREEKGYAEFEKTL